MGMRMGMIGMCSFFLSFGEFEEQDFLLGIVGGFFFFLLPFVLPFLDAGCCRYPLHRHEREREREIEKTLSGFAVVCWHISVQTRSHF
jgi:hypothetical protein